ncbi:hypothetical protein evm_000136 [Chilo suppressalis]|nr:hypothetical protein evm_000136 [Chilo suppressalis]
MHCAVKWRFNNRCVNCTITLRNPRIVSRGVLELDTPIRDLLISWISPIEVSSDYRVREECFVILQIQAQMDEPCRNYGHRSVCLGCGVSVLRAGSIPMGGNRHECTVIQAWVPQIQADLSIFTRVCRPCWRRANRAQATSTASSQQELDQIMPIFVDFYIAEIVAKALSKLNVPNYLGQYVTQHNLNRQRVNFRNISAHLPHLSTFPCLTMSQLEMISLGNYQIKQARSYYGEHVRDGGMFVVELNSQLEVPEEENINRSLI